MSYLDVVKKHLTTKKHQGFVAYIIKSKFTDIALICVQKKNSRD